MGHRTFRENICPGPSLARVYARACSTGTIETMRAGCPAAEDSRSSTAWLSLDAEDNELRRFLSYPIAALATIDPETGQATGHLLRLPQLPPTEIILTTLINELCSLPTDPILVLEDYHTIEAGAIHKCWGFSSDIPCGSDPVLPDSEQ